MNGLFLLLLLFAAHSLLTWRRLLAYLRYFQQEGYEHLRFIRWVKLQPLTDPALWLAVGSALLAGGPSRLSPALGALRLDLTGRQLIAILVFIAGALLFAVLEPDPRRSGKVTLKLTWRATRVIGVAVVLATLAWLVLMFVLPPHDVRSAILAAALTYAAVPLMLMAANGLLIPYERSAQAAYEADAVRRVRDIKPFIIGITGSYGKSSAKAMLAHILQYKGPTLAASGSINTLMGVTRHLREALVPGHEFMVVEMGAFKAGSIARLCQLTPPSAGLITAVGDMHLERFGSLDEIVRAKSELAQAVPKGGLLVVNADSPGALRIARGAGDRRVLLYGETSSEPLETRLESIQVSRKGTSFVLRTREQTWRCFTPLFGRPIMLNLTGVFTLASALGLEPSMIVAAMRGLKPVPNRLEVVEERGVTWIRDAYNSNQFGFRAALEVGAVLPASRRFLATPGVIELGPEQYDVNRALSREAALVCDRTLVVAETNRSAFAAGHHDAGHDERLVAVAGRTEAFRWLNENLQDGDLVILENDLPDLYERQSGLFL
jgi:UDP-N-acetylmuramoyl-tripeptide--D-alanyl-D-alanine ligase